jgi:hypothetical protein
LSSFVNALIHDPIIIAVAPFDLRKNLQIAILPLESTNWPILLVQHLLLKPILQGSHVWIDSLVEFEGVGYDLDW